VTDRKTESAPDQDDRLSRAIRLFEFLARVQQVKTPIIRSVESYEREGQVIWLHSLPDDPSIASILRVGATDVDSPIVMIDRIPHVLPPMPPGNLAEWLDGPIDNPDIEPSLVNAHFVEHPRQVEVLPSGDGDPADAELESQHLDERPDVSGAFTLWFASWSSWADAERKVRPARDAYALLFSSYIRSTSQVEEFELVAGVGCLSWKTSDGQAVQRHAFVCPASISFDDTTGQLTVTAVESDATLTQELDMLPPEVVSDPQRVNDIRDAARDLSAHPLDREEISLLGRRLVHTLDPDGQYLEDTTPASSGDDAVMSYAPALILRKRSKLGLIQVFQTIASQIRSAEAVPEGLLPLIDPNYRPDPGLAWDGTCGAVIAVDGESFLPLPVNAAQLRVIQRVDSSAQILVQGPPGTGKTHTAAALLSHLLAQGKRVLVTAQTDRALKEVRGKLPESIKPLSVAVVGTGREDMADLKVAVERIANAASEHDSAASEFKVKTYLTRIDELRRERASVHHDLIEARESEVRVYERPGIKGTLAAIAQAHQLNHSAFGWIEHCVDVPVDVDCPITNDELREWRTLLCDASLQVNQEEALKSLAEPSDLVTPEDFADLVDAESLATSSFHAYADLTDDEPFRILSGLDPEASSTVRRGLRWIIDEVSLLTQHPTVWSSAAVNDVRKMRAGPWRSRRDQIAILLETAKPLLTWLGPVERVRGTGDLGRLVVMATAVRAYIDSGGKIKVDSLGRAKIGVIANKVVKESAPLFSGISVDGTPPTSVAQLDMFLTWARVEQILIELDHAWPDGVVIPPDDTQTERLAWHAAELAQLDRVIAMAEYLESLGAMLTSLGLRTTNWSDDVVLEELLRVIDAVDANRARDAAQQPLARLSEATGQAARWRNAATCIGRLDASVSSLDSEGYARAWDRLHELLKVRVSIVRRDGIGERVEFAAPRLCAEISDQPSDRRWDVWLPDFEDAWQWAAIGAWVRRREHVDMNLLQQRLDAIEDEIRSLVENLAAERAWGHAVAPDRMTGQARADLEQYAYLVRRHGKGTSVKYGAQRRAEIRQAMDRCRPSVPVWILPIYRIAEQLRIAPDIFDVVIIDEASQAGLEATFLQYLAPKIVVIGDDKQVSPSAVGVDQQQLRDLADQYLYDDRYRASWLDPKRSLFDEAKMRYGGTTTLVEHRRCVPEIIGFSNRVAYEPEGIRLIPVRQYGADRLEPIKTVYLSEGYAIGSTTRVNPTEVEAVVDQIEKCLADADYDGMTFGVISLQGTAQAKLIEKALLDRIPPEEWAARDLRCGDSADFQGSERNVMFLSMVAAVDSDRRMKALTELMYLQRYNVAASRAKDQMWLFHSINLAELTNTEDMRFQLLDYCYGVRFRAGQEDMLFTNPVPDDVRIQPFDSLFEQRVFNIVVDRGFSVVPQFEVEGYFIDLVIVGAQIKVAIECDGDHWHGPDRYEADLARKRDLQRNGWNFFNVRESLFYVDKAAAMAPLWEMLDAFGVHPSGWTPPAETADGASHTSIRESFERSEPEDYSAGNPSRQGPTLTMQGQLGKDTSNESPSSDPVPQPVSATRTSPIEDLLETGIDRDEKSMRGAEQSREAPTTDGLFIAISRSDSGSSSTSHSSSSRALKPYREFEGATTPALEAQIMELVAELVAIAEVEGPLVGERLHQAHVRSSGKQRVGRQVASALNKAVLRATSQGLLVEDNPLSEQGVKPKTYRVPAQPTADPRELGPRTLELVPPAELAILLLDAAEAQGWTDEERVFRNVLDRLGIRRMTPNAIAHLQRIRSIAPHMEAQ
jgi:hypothetical protein